jgi:signal transduction histidine kinase
VARHARASHVDVTLAVTTSELRLSVHDDGHGLSPSALQATAGHGLQNMRARAERLGGQLHIDSPDDSGTRLSWCVPQSPLG